KIIEYKDKKCAYKKDLLNKNNIIVAAKNSDDIQKFIKYENLYYTHPEASICIGAYLGYPKCCIKNHFKKIFTDGNFNELAVDKKWKQLKQEKITCPLVNNRWPLFSHYFCSFKCKETYEIAHEVLHYLAKKYGQTIVPYYFNYVKNLK
ncbi:MAG: hypothetical protein NT116_04425, partial [Candidatus Parcubacteria bacterium]|nr:hypothetical protein [Candidatus Parcubacteria bacterium]